MNEWKIKINGKNKDFYICLNKTCPYKNLDDLCEYSDEKYSIRCTYLNCPIKESNKQ
jgi:hypothetical protein